MGWRDDADLEKALRYLTHGVGSNEEVFAALLAMPPADRIALARELLAGTGRVVAREVRRVEREDAPEPNQIDGDDDAWVNGWNACRAAMMQDRDGDEA
jgi:hypothetical protein